MMEATIDQVIVGWKDSKEQLYTPEFVLTFHTILQSLMMGEAISLDKVSRISGLSKEQVFDAWQKLQESGAKMGEDTRITGAVLSLTPTMTKFEVEGRELYAWCALDAMFLPGLLGKAAKVKTISPANGEQILFSSGPDGVETIEPAGAVLTVEIPETITSQSSGANLCTSGPSCSLNHFFSSTEAAGAWIGHRSDIVILSLDEAWKMAKQAWIEPFHNALSIARQ